MSKTQLLLNSINTFYSDDKNSIVLENILKKNLGISLRKLEWFITDYSRKNKTSYTTSSGKIFPVHCAYKSSLDGYSKKLFDPFCRTNKIEYTIPNTDKTIKTSIAQLNFIKWCIQNNVIEYISKNLNIKQNSS